MYDLEKTLLQLKYMTNPNYITKDIEEFTDTFKSFIDLIGNPDILYRMSVDETLNMLVSMKEFNDNIKPLIIKFGIIPYLKEEN